MSKGTGQRGVRVVASDRDAEKIRKPERKAPDRAALDWVAAVTGGKVEPHDPMIAVVVEESREIEKAIEETGAMLKKARATVAELESTLEQQFGAAKGIVSLLLKMAPEKKPEAAEPVTKSN